MPGLNWCIVEKITITALIIINKYVIWVIQVLKHIAEKIYILIRFSTGEP